MEHGTQKFFEERAAARRRVAVISNACGAVLLALLGISQLPLFSRALRETPFVHFGFQGPTRYVRLLRVEAVPGNEPLVNVGKVVSRPMRRGGEGGALKPGRTGRAAESRPHRLPGAGETSEDLVERALSGRSGVPVFQSEELVIDHLVRPVYPEDARDHGVEGHVSVIAHVDTSGAVVETQVWVASGTMALDQAAETAVRQCRFRPYRIGGEVRDVYAVFSFAFSLY
jgi:TonB family protein